MGLLWCVFVCVLLQLLVRWYKEENIILCPDLRIFFCFVSHSLNFWGFGFWTVGSGKRLMVATSSSSDIFIYCVLKRRQKTKWYNNSVETKNIVVPLLKMIWHLQSLEGFLVPTLGIIHFSTLWLTINRLFSVERCSSTVFPRVKLKPFGHSVLNQNT